MKTTARILLVDDDDHVRDALVDELSPTYTIEAVASANEALEKIATERYDVIISDLKMPDHDGIEVLEFARAHQGDAVRVLLTGYLDERAHEALLAADAPYKVGKPWHDEIEIVVRRGLEQRAAARRLHASVEDALRLSTFDAELAATSTPLDLVDVLVRRCLAIEGVVTCGGVVRVDGKDRVLSGSRGIAAGTGWILDTPIDGDGQLRLVARGVGESSRQLVSYMAHRAQRRCGVLGPGGLQLHALDHTSTRLNQLMRQATLGALTSALLHDLASAVQNLSSSLSELRALVAEDTEASEAAKDASEVGDAILQMFVTMRKFIREGDVQTRSVPVARLVDRAVRMSGAYVRERATLRIGELPDVEVCASESLMLQVLTNLLRNAANASPAGGTVDLCVALAADKVVLSVTDDGPGVEPAIADQMFEPFATTTAGGTGLGLAISAYVIQQHGGRITYRRHAERGALFEVTLQRAS